MRGVRIKDHWKEQRLFDHRALFAGGVAGLLILVLAIRLFTLQVVRHDYYAQQSQANRVRIEPIPAARGLILDRNGTVLAGLTPGYQLELVREAVPDLDTTLEGLVNIGLLTTDEVPEVRRTILSRRSFDNVSIRLRMSDEDVARFAVHRFEFPGVDIQTRQMRWYPNGELAVHALGYVSALSPQDLQKVDANEYAGTSVIGKLGVEAAYERELHGTNGFRQIFVNALGRSVEKLGSLGAGLRTQAPVSGDDLVLGLDMGAQQAAENGLGDHRGAVVALDPANGDVIALASKPGFDPTLFARGITTGEYATLANDPGKPLLNRALRGAYPSGSTIKPVLGLVALTDSVITADRKLLCTGTYHLPNSRHIFRADKQEPRGLIDLPEAIARSSDVYFYQLANAMGIERIAAGLEHFGYGRPTGIDISGERAGLLPTPEWKRTAFKRTADQVWVPGDTVNLGVGQGYLLVTPLQLAHIAGVIAERGRNFRPRLVRGTRDADGRTKLLAPVEDRPVTGVADADWTTVIDAMIGTTRCLKYCGTASRAFTNAPYTAAGKTGTAQVYTVAQNEKYNEKTVADELRDHAWFVAFAPAEAPRIAVAVLAENAGFGAGTAAPIARAVIDAYLLTPDGRLKPWAIPPAAPATAPAPAAHGPEPAPAQPARRTHAPAAPSSAPPSSTAPSATEPSATPASSPSAPAPTPTPAPAPGPAPAPAAGPASPAQART